MLTPILTTKLYIPPPRPGAVPRPQLIARLHAGFAAGHKLTLISAPAGFGKTTLVSEWVNQRTGEPTRGQPVAWLSLDAGDSDPTRFLMYCVAALQTLALSEAEGIAPDVGAGIMAALQSPQPPSIEMLLTTLLNEIATRPKRVTLVLDDYHTLDSPAVDAALAFLLDHQPSQLHLVIASREDPSLPLARLRARGQLTELRAADLRFTPAEAADLLNRVMHLDLPPEAIAALETRTEGWIAGLQLAAISMQGQSDTASFIKSFTGSHHFVLDYLVEEVLHQQPENVQTFLLYTSILDRMCGSLCDAILRAPLATGQTTAGQETVEYLERANMFVVPLDHERHWYRYHHLFGDLLRKRLGQRLSPQDIAGLHIHASQWYEDQGWEIEAFQHAVAANDIERAGRLTEGKGMPLHFRGAVAPVLNWLESLPKTVLDANPLLWTTYASVLLVSGQQTAAEQTLQFAEAALKSAGPVSDAGDGSSDNIRDTIGRIAAIRATLALNQYQMETSIAQSQRALEYLHPDNLPFRTFTIWKLGYAYQLQGDRAAASQAYTEANAISQASGNMITAIAATIGLGNLQESDNQLYVAAQTYQRVLQMFGDQPLPIANHAHLGLARIYYEWNDIDAAQQHAQQSVQLARQSEHADTFVRCEVFLARLKLTRGDVAGAAAMLGEIEQSVRRHNFVQRMPEVAAAQVLVLLCQHDVAAATRLVQLYDLPFSQARVYLAQEDTANALVLLSSLRQQMKAKGWQDERLRAIVLEVVALCAHGEKDQAAQLLGDALALAEPGGFIRLFVDEGEPMRLLLEKHSHNRVQPQHSYVDKLLAAFAQPESTPQSKISAPKPELVEPLSQRELDVLRLIAEGLSNHEIGARLFLALDTVKGHNRRIFDKLQVQRRTEAIARARELGLL